MSAIRLTIDGMTCEHCRKKVEAALMGVSGVWGVEVNLAERSADVQCDVRRAKPEELIAAVEAAGYRAEVTG